MIHISREEYARLKQLTHDKAVMEALKKHFLLKFLHAKASAEEIDKLGQAFISLENIDLPDEPEEPGQVAL